MKKRIDREKIKSFLFRRKANTLGLLAIMALSILLTVIFALRRSPRTGVLAVVSLLLALLFAVQVYRMRSSYRTIPSFRGSRRRKKSE